MRGARLLSVKLAHKVQVVLAVARLLGGRGRLGLRHLGRPAVVRLLLRQGVLPGQHVPARLLARRGLLLVVVRGRAHVLGMAHDRHPSVLLLMWGERRNVERLVVGRRNAGAGGVVGRGRG